MYCECGCGQLTSLAKQTRKCLGHVKGKPVRFLPGHQRVKTGYKLMSSNGYIYIFNPDHPRCNTKGYVKRSILTTEKALGKPLPLGAEVHHLNEIKHDDTPTNLVICHDRAYHMLLHVRKRAIVDCGNPNWRKCWICHKYDDPKNLGETNKSSYFHYNCYNRLQRQRRRKRLDQIADKN